MVDSCFSITKMYYLLSFHDMTGVKRSGCMLISEANESVHHDIRNPKNKNEPCTIDIQSSNVSELAERERFELSHSVTCL